MTLSEELQWRGFANQTTYQNLDILDGDPITFYWGVDPSADSMQIGNLATAMMVRKFISKGHKAVLLVGGATGLIGDPDGKSEERTLKSLELVKTNKAGIVAQYQQVFGGQSFDVVDNYDWFKDMGYLDFLREVGKHVPMRQMLARDFVKDRLGEDGAGISYAEFSYALIQGYDFLHLSREHNVTLQVCGSDQWGNSIAGVELIRRIDGKEAHVYSAPLIVNKATGVKFGKSEDGAVWLDPAKTSVYKFYQFWLNLDDDGVEDYLKIYTELDKDALDKLMLDFNASRAGRLAQKTLAYEVTKLVHGQDRAESVVRATGALFGDGFLELSDVEKSILKEELPVIQADGQTIQSMLVVGDLASSNSDANRLIVAGSVSINGQKVAENGDISLKNGANLLKRGKNGFAIIEQND